MASLFALTQMNRSFCVCLVSLALSMACGDSGDGSKSSLGSGGETVAGEAGSASATATASEGGTMDGESGASASGGEGGDSCGNGVVEGNEVCDGDELDGEDCEELGYSGGELLCAEDCMSFIVTDCEGASCGDNMAQDPESCDGSDLNGRSCEDFGFSGGELICTADCQEYDVSNCEEDCDMDAAAQCELEGAMQLVSCVSECPGDACEASICEADCGEEQQKDLEDCYEQAGCIFDANDADCIGECLEDLKDCAEDTDCDPMCATALNSCVNAC